MPTLPCRNNEAGKGGRGATFAQGVGQSGPPKCRIYFADILLPCVEATYCGELHETMGQHLSRMAIGFTVGHSSGMEDFAEVKGPPLPVPPL